MSKNVWHVNLNDPYLELIEKGIKTAEGRVFKGEFAQFKEGDQIKFVDKNNVERFCLCEICYLHKYKSFKEMLQKEGLDVLLPGIAGNIEDGTKIYQFFPGYKEKEKVFGVVAIGVRILKKKELF